MASSMTCHIPGKEYQNCHGACKICVSNGNVKTLESEFSAIVGAAIAELGIQSTNGWYQQATKRIAVSITISVRHTSVKARPLHHLDQNRRRRCNHNPVCHHSLCSPGICSLRQCAGGLCAIAWQIKHPLPGNCRHQIAAASGQANSAVCLGWQRCSLGGRSCCCRWKLDRAVQARKG